jgi:hypothetical protein
MWIRCDAVGISTEGWCPEGEFFDPIERFCDDEENVDCRNPPTRPGPPIGPTRPGGPPNGPTRPGGGPPTRPGITTTRIPSTTQPPSRRPQWNWVCEPQHVGPERWPHPDCKFIFILFKCFFVISFALISM